MKAPGRPAASSCVTARGPQEEGSRRRGSSARDCVLMESARLRVQKFPREFVLPALEAAVIEAGYDEATAQREALAAWRQFWERREGERGA